MQAALNHIRHIIVNGQKKDQDDLILELNIFINGWNQFHRTLPRFSRAEEMNQEVTKMLLDWGRMKNPQQDDQWITSRYWSGNLSEGWRFEAEGARLETFYGINTQQEYLPIRTEDNPYLDGGDQTTDPDYTKSDLYHHMKRPFSGYPPAPWINQPY